MGLEKVSKQIARRKVTPAGELDPKRAAIWDHERGRWVEIMRPDGEVEAAAKHQDREVERQREQRAKAEKESA